MAYTKGLSNSEVFVDLAGFFIILFGAGMLRFSSDYGIIIGGLLMGVGAAIISFSRIVHG